MLWLIKRDNSWQNLDFKLRDYSWTFIQRNEIILSNEQSCQKHTKGLWEAHGKMWTATLWDSVLNKARSAKKIPFAAQSQGIPDPSAIPYFLHYPTLKPRGGTNLLCWVKYLFNPVSIHQNHNIHRTLWRFVHKLPGGKIPTTNQANAGMVQTCPLSCGPRSCLFTQLLCQILDSSSCTTCVRCMYN